MDTAFYASLVSDTVLAAVLWALFVYASRISRERRGMQAWGWGHFLYTLGSALIDAGAHRAAAGHADTTLILAAAFGTPLTTLGLTGLAWSVTAVAGQRSLRRSEKLWMPVALVAGGVAAAVFLAEPRLNYAAPALAMTAFELAALLVMAWRLRALDRLPYRLPARLMQAGCALLLWMYAGDLLRIIGRESLGRYLPAIELEKADLSLWFLLNFCMLMIVSFRAVETYRQSAHVDPLTGLLNRRGLQAMLRQRMEEAPALATAPLAVLMIDLDHFKTINDRHGHAAGDAVLRHVAAVLERTVRGTDLPTRVGGEEFAVVLPDTAEPTAHELAERLRARLAAQPLDDVAPGLRVTASIGVACGRRPQASLQELLDAADVALYRAKAEGRDRVVVSQELG